MADSTLTVDDFEGFFHAVHGHEPFSWQSRLARQIAADGQWPALLDLPTGAGKTAALDIAVFLLALDTARPPGQRTAPRRVVLVVDRRVIVDQAHDRALRIVQRLDEASAEGDGVLARVADALRERQAVSDDLAGGPVLVAQSLRGGVVRDGRWALRPDLPVLVSSTVDQVGSRLLFRGYGDSRGTRPITAGLLGEDCLFLLDEVHLSQPFAETLEAVARYRNWNERPGIPDRWQVVQLSATASRTDNRFELGALGPRDEVLSRRVRAHKPVTLRAVRQTGDKARRQIVAAAVDEALAALRADHVRAVGVVLNRVASAREAAAALRSRVDEEVSVHLVTGRMRELDREAVLESVMPHVRLGRDRARAQRVILVSTQSIEAGADLDLDALVTECASLDALRQRFGRLDRDGRLSAAGTPALGTVLGGSRDTAEGVDDPIYGGALAATWRWLTRLDGPDMGIEHLPAPEDLAGLLPHRPSAPVLLPGHVDAWVQTTGETGPDPDVSRWLHGIVDTYPEVTIVWRDDIDETLLREWDRGRSMALDLLSACPPTAPEGLQVPLIAARAWLQGGPAPQISDVEGEAAGAEPSGHEPQPGRAVLRWDGEGSTPVRGVEIRPGDTLVVPSGYGGVRDGTWDPQSIEPVSDLGAEALWRNRGLAALRLPVADLTDGVIDRGESPPKVQAAPLTDHLRGLLAAEGPRDLHDVVRHLLGLRASPGGTRGASSLARDAVARLVTIRDDHELVVVTRRRARDMRDQADAEAETSAFTGATVTLVDHGAGVAALAAALATSVELPDHLVQDLELAGRLHDLGKHDPRFQVLLHGGDEIAAAASAPIAKSLMSGQDRMAWQAARRRSGYPNGARHELLSLALVRALDAKRLGAHDTELVEHLVVSHHGWGRPFVPLIPDPDPRDVTITEAGRSATVSTAHGLERLDSGIVDSFWRLVQRYGWWGLAHLEAVLRLADHRRSEAEAGRSFRQAGS